MTKTQRLVSGIIICFAFWSNLRGAEEDNNGKTDSLGVSSLSKADIKIKGKAYQLQLYPQDSKGEVEKNPWCGVKKGTTKFEGDFELGIVDKRGFKNAFVI